MEILEEFDIPILDRNKQLELGICFECGKRKAKFQCDYITGKTFDLYGKGKIEESMCSAYLCEKCTNKLNERDYCKKHYEELKKRNKGVMVKVDKTLEDLGYNKRLLGKTKIVYSQVLDEDSGLRKAIWFDKYCKMVHLDGYYNSEEIFIIYNQMKGMNW